MKKILIIRCGALGDLVYSTSIIDAMREQFGEDTIIDFVCSLQSGKLFEKDTRVRSVFPLSHKRIPTFFSSEKKQIIQTSYTEKYDLLINLEKNKFFKTLESKIFAKKKINSFNNHHDTKETKHVVDSIKSKYQFLVTKEVLDKSFPRLVGTSIDEVLKKFNLPQKFIIVSPSNSHQKKSKLNYRAWQNESWKELISKLSEHICVVIVGNQGEEHFFDVLKPYGNNVIDLVGKTSICDLIGVIESARALVSTDTGTSHIASAVNTEVFALIGPTNANVTGPYKTPFNKVHIISSYQSCSPCYKTDIMQLCTNNICMKEISVDMVLESMKKANCI